MAQGGGGHRIEGNFIGTDLGGTKPLGNAGNGLNFDDSGRNQIGGKRAARRNVISGNGGFGVSIHGLSATNNLVGDLDGDGFPDLAATSFTDGNVSGFKNMLQPGETIMPESFSKKAVRSAGDGVESLVIGDLDGDGRPDLVVGNRTCGAISVFQNAVALCGQTPVRLQCHRVDSTHVRLEWLANGGCWQLEGGPCF